MYVIVWPVCLILYKSSIIFIGILFYDLKSQ